MKAHQLLITGLAAIVLTITQANAALSTVGGYDPTGDGSNNIDAEASGNDILLADFRTLVSDAFDNDHGGVVNFDSASSELNGFTANFGLNSTLSLSVSAGSNNVVGSGSTTGWNVANASGSNGATSDPNVLRGAWVWDFDFGTGLTAVAITFIERNNDNPTVVATIELQDGTRPEKFNGTANNDTFFAYTALASNPIVSLELDTSDGNNKYHEIDDLAFVLPVPVYSWEGGTGSWSTANWDDGMGNTDENADTGYEVVIDSAGSDVTLDSDWDAAKSLTLAQNNSSTLTINSARTLDVTNATTVGSSGTLNVNGTLNAGSLTSAGTTTFATGSGGTITSGTSVTGGVMTVNGTVTSDIDVASGATLKGGGTVNGTVTIAEDGTLNAGNSPGTITVDNLTFEDGADHDWEFASATVYDKTIVTNTLTFEGALDITLVPFGQVYDPGTVFTLFEYGTLAFTGNFEDIWNVTYGGSLDKWGGTATFADTGSAITLTGITYIPEPATLVWLGLGLTYFFRRRRRQG